MSHATSNEVWKLIAPIFGLEGMGVKSFELRLKMNEPAEITATHLVTAKNSTIATEIATRFRLVPAEGETE